MNPILLAISAFCACALFSGCSPKSEAQATPVELTTPTIVEAACGRCLFGRKEDNKCNLAIRLEGESFFVDGFTMRQFGNPDHQGGMCKKVHPAQVTGKIVNRRFAATSFEIVSLASR